MGARQESWVFVRGIIILRKSRLVSSTATDMGVVGSLDATAGCAGDLVFPLAIAAV